MQREIVRLREHGFQCGIGVFSAPTPGRRHRRVPIGAEHQAEIPDIDQGSNERGDTLIKVEVVHFSCVAVVLTPSPEKNPR